MKLAGFALFLLVASAVGCSGGASIAPGGAPPSAAATASPTPGGSPAPTAAPTPAPSATPAQAALCLPEANPTAAAVVRNPVKLGAYNVDPNKVFVAGISAGGFFAVQMHVAHSKTFKGAAVYAGGVYYCAQDSIALALVECGGQTNLNCQALYFSTLASSESYLDAQSAAGTIDPASNLQGQPVYLFSGTKDQVVNPAEVDDLQSEYRHYGASVTFDNAIPANHGWESPDGEVPCPTATSPYMISCSVNGQVYDSVKTWLTLFFGPLNARNDGTLSGSLVNFDQSEFGAAASNSLDTNGWLFVPQACASGAKCGFVLALHGCIQNQGVIGTKFVSEAGIDEWADTNNIIVMYPYAVLGSGTTINPKGCFDWWGYDDPNYALKSGTQMTIVYRMVQRVTGLP